MVTMPKINSTTRAILLTVVAVLSILWTIYDWGSFSDIKSRLVGVEYVAFGLVMTEILFIVGAVVMLAAVGEELPRLHLGKWLHNIGYIKREIKTIASQAIASKLFGLGFWLNFVGAIGTSVILMLGIIRFFPIQSWGLLLILSVDLLATFGWRVPLQVARRKA